MDATQSLMEPQRHSDNGDPCAEFLTFSLGDEIYGVDILKVQEIRGYDTVTRLPNAPDFIKGVINLRGTIVPVVDMRLKFQLGRVDYNEFTVMIILNIARRVVGMVVDGVSDVMQLTPNRFVRPRISAAPSTPVSSPASAPLTIACSFWWTSKSSCRPPTWR